MAGIAYKDAADLIGDILELGQSRMDAYPEDAMFALFWLKVQLKIDDWLDEHPEKIEDLVFKKLGVTLDE